MSGNKVERSESGAPILRHEPGEREWRVPRHAAENLDEVTAHVERHIGNVETVWHEILSDLIHLDVLLVPATAERPYNVLVTSGVSDEPMKVPEGREMHRRAELLIALPEDWPLTEDAFKDETNYWPVRWLKTVGRLPHEHRTWIGWGHSIPNGDPAQPIAGTGFIGVMLTPPYGLSPDLFCLTTKAGETVWFYMLVPLFQEEMDLKLKIGAEGVEQRLEKARVGFVLDVDRANVAMKKGWFR